MCRIWGRQKRRIIGKPRLMQDAVALCLVDTQTLVFRGTAPSGNARGIAGRVLEEGPVGAAIQNARKKSPPEVLTGDALNVSIAIQLAMRDGEMTAVQHESLIAHYILSGKLDTKLQRLGI